MGGLEASGVLVGDLTLVSAADLPNSQMSSHPLWTRGLTRPLLAPFQKLSLGHEAGWWWEGI